MSVNACVPEEPHLPTDVPGGGASGRVIQLSQKGITASPPRRQGRQEDHGRALASWPQDLSGGHVSPAGQRNEWKMTNENGRARERRLDGPRGLQSRLFIAGPLGTPSVRSQDAKTCRRRSRGKGSGTGRPVVPVVLGVLGVLAVSAVCRGRTIEPPWLRDSSRSRTLPGSVSRVEGKASA